VRLGDATETRWERPNSSKASHGTPRRRARAAHGTRRACARSGCCSSTTPAIGRHYCSLSRKRATARCEVNAQFESCGNSYNPARRDPLCPSRDSTLRGARRVRRLRRLRARFGRDASGAGDAALHMTPAVAGRRHRGGARRRRRSAAPLSRHPFLALLAPLRQARALEHLHLEAQRAAAAAALSPGGRSAFPRRRPRRPLRTRRSKQPGRAAGAETTRDDRGRRLRAGAAAHGQWSCDQARASAAARASRSVVATSPRRARTRSSAACHRS
jgi:hypothetical protein